MQYTIEEITSLERKILVQLNKDDVNKALDEVISEFAKNIEVKGFKKGKAPHDRIETEYSEKIQKEATDKAVDDAVQKIFQETKINPLSQVRFDYQEGEQTLIRNNSFKFTFYFEILPNVPLPELDKLTIKVFEPNITPKDVYNVTRRFCKGKIQLTEIKELRTPQASEICIIDFESLYQNKPVPGMQGKNYYLKLEEGNNTELNKITFQLKNGEEKISQIVVPQDYSYPLVRGKEVSLKVKLKQIYKETLPEMTEELAISLGFKNLKDFERTVLSQAMNIHAQKVKLEGQQKLLNELIEPLKIELPISLLAFYKSEYLQEVKERLKICGHNSNEISVILKDLSQFAEEEAIKNTKIHIFLLSLAIRENLSISEDELNKHINQLAIKNKQSPDELYKFMQENNIIQKIEDRLLTDKAMELLYNKTKKIMIDKDGKDIRVDK
ncbi:trigger factor [Desulfovibrio litoralis]|uniref:Trigger factor n=1 Tax=Desulfovibrio litoralis DSM 11393 TaxID=1121455 RepID=A0A1M7SML0_9BACT|nr:trigger factor [Desulfovibrio litoralis]SHN59715.1 trigger factor [Desulfovibrio litoralis DSM 11393]